MARRRPPTWPPHTDRIAKECGVTTVTFNDPIPARAWCHYCGYLAESRDHVVPDSVGGARDWWNLVPACHACNGTKQDRQACACLYCLRAIALWHLGYRRKGQSYRERKIGKKQRRLERGGGADDAEDEA